MGGKPLLLYELKLYQVRNTFLLVVGWFIRGLMAPTWLLGNSVPFRPGNVRPGEEKDGGSLSSVRGWVPVGWIVHRLDHFEGGSGSPPDKWPFFPKMAAVFASARG